MLGFFRRRRGLLLGFEAVLIMGLTLAAAMIRLGPKGLISYPHLPWKALLVALVTQMMMYYFGLYDPTLAAARAVLYRRTLAAVGASVVACLALFWLSPALEVGRGIFFLTAILMVLVLPLWRVLIDLAFSNRGVRHRTLIVGAGDLAVELGRLVALARQHADHVFSVAVGNECTVDWSDHIVPVPRMVEYVRRVKAAVAQPVTFCENYVPWQAKLAPLVAELDFISVHTYPVWEYKHIHEALDYTKDNVDSVARLYPGKPVVITEAGWCTASNGRGMHAGHAVQELQAAYVRDLMDWSRAAGLLCFVFEAFDEPWKGSADPLEPEKHWGLFTVERRPKLVLRDLFAELAPAAGADLPADA